MKNRHAIILTLLLCLFIMRVAGQILVVFFGASYLPPLQEWQSGLLPYPALLFSQITIILVLSKICRDIAFSDGYFAQAHTKLGRFLHSFGSIYLASMVLRYIVWMCINPDARWFHGTIPIAFHCVLASFLIVLANFYTGKTYSETFVAAKRIVS